MLTNLDLVIQVIIPFKKKEVRQALYQAIDIEAIKKKVMRGLSEPAGIITFPGVTWLH